MSEWVSHRFRPIPLPATRWHSSSPQRRTPWAFFWEKGANCKDCKRRMENLEVSDKNIIQTSTLQASSTLSPIIASLSSGSSLWNFCNTLNIGVFLFPSFFAFFLVFLLILFFILHTFLHAEFSSWFSFHRFIFYLYYLIFMSLLIGRDCQKVTMAHSMGQLVTIGPQCGSGLLHLLRLHLPWLDLTVKRFLGPRALSTWVSWWQLDPNVTIASSKLNIFLDWTWLSRGS